MSQGSPGYNSAVYATGTSTSMTDEACTEVSTTVFQVTSTAKRIVDHAVAVVVKANTVVQASTTYVVDYNTGTITFTSSHTGETVTVTANYLPRHAIAKALTTTIAMLWRMAETGCMGDAGEAHTPTIMSVTASIEAVQFFADVDLYGTTSLMDRFDAKAIYVYEFQPSGSGQKVVRARVTGQSITINSGGPSDVVTGTLNFVASNSGATLVSYAAI